MAKLTDVPMSDLRVGQTVYTIEGDTITPYELTAIDTRGNLRVVRPGTDANAIEFYVDLAQTFQTFEEAKKELVDTFSARLAAANALTPPTAGG